MLGLSFTYTMKKITLWSLLTTHIYILLISRIRIFDTIREQFGWCYVHHSLMSSGYQWQGNLSRGSILNPRIERCVVLGHLILLYTCGR